LGVLSDKPRASKSVGKGLILRWYGVHKRGIKQRGVKSLAGTDLSINNTDMQTIKLMSVTMESRAQDASFGGNAS
jgi:hypothetical protein